MNLHGYKKSKKKMIRMIKKREGWLDKERDKKHPDSKKVKRLVSEVRRIADCKNDCAKRICELKREKKK